MDEVTVWQEILQIVIPLATVVVGALTSWALAMLSAYIKSKTTNETLLTAYDQAQGMIRDVVAQINQEVKSAGADGKITAEEAQKIKQIALTSVRTQFPPWLKSNLTNAVGDLEAWINTQIEAAVYNAKNGK